MFMYKSDTRNLVRRKSKILNQKNVINWTIKMLKNENEGTEDQKCLEWKKHNLRILRRNYDHREIRMLLKKCNGEFKKSKNE